MTHHLPLHPNWKLERGQKEWETDRRDEGPMNSGHEDIYDRDEERGDNQDWSKYLAEDRLDGYQGQDEEQGEQIGEDHQLDYNVIDKEVAVDQLFHDEPSRTSSYRISLRSDLPSHMSSSEMPDEAQTVNWPNGQVTVLSTIMRNGHDICIRDVQYVRQLATVPMSPPTSIHVDHVEAKSLQGVELCGRVAVALRHGRCAVVHGATEPGPKTLTPQIYGISLWQRTTHHGW